MKGGFPQPTGGGQNETKFRLRSQETFARGPPRCAACLGGVHACSLLHTGKRIGKVSETWGRPLVPS